MNNLFNQSFKDYYEKAKKGLVTEKFLSADNIKQRFGRSDDPTAYINVHINPDHSEVLEVIKDFKETSPDQYKKNGEMDFVRGFFDVEGNLYIWYGTFFHDNVESFLKNQPKTKNVRKNEKFRFAWLKGDNHLTLEGESASKYFNHYENNEHKLGLIKRLVTAFPMVKTEDSDGNLNVRTDANLKAWVPVMGSDKSSSEKSSNSNSSDIKSVSPIKNSEFDVGDIVEVLIDNPDDNTYIKKGMKGKVVDFISRPPNIAVEFEKEVGHNCRGKAKDKHGWYLRSSEIKKVSEEKSKPVSKEKTKDLAKIDDIIVFKNNYSGGGKVKILAVAWIETRGEKQYHYIYKSRKKDSIKYTAKKILDAEHIHFIDGKYNIKSADEPFSSILSTGNYIDKIIPNPDRVEKRPDNLYEPKRKEGEQTYRAYTDRR